MRRVNGGYWLSDAAMRDTVAGWSAAREQLAVRQEVIDALRLAIADQSEHVRAQLDAIKAEAARDRARLKAKARSGKLQGVALGLLIGVVIAVSR